MDSENLKKAQEYVVEKVSILDFELVFIPNEPVPSFKLACKEVPEENPVDCTKGWLKVTKRRPTGARDNTYLHKSCRKQLRSLREVANHIQFYYELKDDERMGQISKEHPIFLVYAPSEVPNRNVEKEDENDKETKTQSQSPQFEANQSEPNSSIGSSGKYLLTTSTGTPKEMDVYKIINYTEEYYKEIRHDLH